MVMQALEAEKEQISKARRVAAVCVKVVRRWLQLSLTSTVAQWRYWVHERARLRRAGKAAVGRLRNLGASRAWALWRSRAAEQQRLRRVGALVVGRMTSAAAGRGAAGGSTSMAHGRWGCGRSGRGRCSDEGDAVL